MDWHPITQHCSFSISAIKKETTKSDAWNKSQINTYLDAQVGTEY